MLKYAALVLTVLSVSACTATSTSLVPSAGSIQAADLLGPTREFAHFAGGRDLYTEIHGNPFPVDDRDFANQVTNILNSRNSSTPTNFTTRPGPSADPAFRAVIVFNRAAPLDGTTLCARPNALRSTGPQAGRIPVDFAFCNGAVQLHSVRGTLPAATGPSDIGFENSLALALALAQPRAQIQ